MDFLTIATFVSLEVASGFLKEHGKEIYHRVKDLLQPEELVSLNLLEKNPSDTHLQEKVATALEKHLIANPQVAGELSDLIEKFPTRTAKQNAISQVGHGNTAIQDARGNVINIKQP